MLSYDGILTISNGERRLGKLRSRPALEVWGPAGGGSGRVSPGPGKRAFPSETPAAMRTSPWRRATWQRAPPRDEAGSAVRSPARGGSVMTLSGCDDARATKTMHRGAMLT